MNNETSDRSDPRSFALILRRNAAKQRQPTSLTVGSDVEPRESMQ
jgi:hypothetical protein